jgi:hypothetical protein
LPLLPAVAGPRRGGAADLPPDTDAAGVRRYRLDCPPGGKPWPYLNLGSDSVEEWVSLLEGKACHRRENDLVPFRQCVKEAVEYAGILAQGQDEFFCLRIRVLQDPARQADGVVLCCLGEHRTAVLIAEKG